MSDKSPFEWTDATWNPVRGCTKISPGCKNCYAERFTERFRGVAGHPFEQGFDLRLVPHALRLPSTWKKGRLVGALAGVHRGTPSRWNSLGRRRRRERPQWGGTQKKRAGRLLEGSDTSVPPNAPHDAR
jgi:protein gp37